MKRKLLVMGLFTTLVAGSVMAATPGEQIGATTQMKVSGTVGTSTCTVTFPTSVTMPTFSSADYNATKQVGVITSQSTSGIQFSGCNGQHVKVVIGASGGTMTGNGLYIYPQLTTANGTTVNNKLFAFGLAADTSDNSNSLYKINQTESTALGNIEINNDSHTVPLTVTVRRMSVSNMTPSYSGNYNSTFAFTATYL
ncbi:hypothetical protein [Escherichia coli]|uniref:hypothetical protein n=1 Tax=Escherichia coli TaxID=562 RepID=UPI0012FFB703|nr:hypothetical protein [Escherichia coli]